MKRLFFKSIWPILAIIFAVLIFFYPVWLKGYVPLPSDFVVGVYFPWLDYKWGFPAGVPVKNPLTTDVVSFMYPMQILAIDLMKSGQWPLWNPYILAGTPLLANFQSAPFSPTNFVYFIFDRLTAWSIQIMLQHFLAALFTFFLLRYWKVSKLGSLFGGIIFAFSGFNLLWSEWNGHALAASFIPLLLLFEDVWLSDKKWWSGTGITVGLACQFYSGYPQVIFYTFLAMGILWFFRIHLTKEFLIKTFLLSLFVILGFGLASPQILPGNELLGESQREIEPHPFEWAFLPFSKVITFLAPDYFGNHATKNYWGPQDYTSNTGFVGTGAFTLAMVPLFFKKKKKNVWFSIVILTLSFILSFPTPVSIGIWKSGLFGFQAASAHRALVLSNLTFAFLAAFGVDCFLNSQKRMAVIKAVILPSAILFGFASYAAVMYYLGQKNPELYEPVVRGIPKYSVALKNMIFPIGIFSAASTVLFFFARKNKNRKTAGLLVVFFLVCLELFRFGWKFNPFTDRVIAFPKTPVLNFLMSQKRPFRTTGSQVIPINMRMPYKIESLEGYDAVYPLRISQFIAALNRKKSGTKPAGRYGTVDNTTSRLVSLVNTKYQLALKFDQNKNPNAQGNILNIYNPLRFKEVFEDKSVAVLEDKDALPRSFMVYDWEYETKDTKILDKLLDDNFPLDKKIILEDPVKDVTLGSPPSQALVKYKTYKEMKNVLTVDTARTGLLFTSDTWYPGWHAFVDGKETKIYRADFAFRAVIIPEGKHEVKFIYHPSVFFNGIKIAKYSAIGLVLLTVFSFALLGKRKAKIYT